MENVSKVPVSENLSDLIAFVQRNQTKFKVLISPTRCVAEGMQYELSYAIRYLQSRMRAALFFFINGSYWLESNFWRAKSLLASGGRVDPHVENILKDILVVITDVHRRFGVFDELFHHLKKVMPYSLSNSDAAGIISIFYREFEVLTANLKIDSRCVAKPFGLLNRCDYPPQDYAYLAPLFELQRYAQRHFKDFLTGFYLHGSLATMDYIPQWSDLDTLMIVSKQTIDNPQDLHELRKRAIRSHIYLYNIDPYQLHGHLLISEFDLAYYPQTFFPSVLLSYAKSFFRDVQAIEYSIRDSQGESVATFWSDAVYYFYHQAIKYKKSGRGLVWNREKKLFVHRLLTFPLFYLQTKGLHVYKRDSFDQAAADFGAEDWQIIKEATGFMNLWNSPAQGGLRLKSAEPLNSVIYLLLLNVYHDIRYLFVDKGFKAFRKQYARWLESALKLCSIGWNNVIANIGPSAKDLP
ncbi:MAG: hypothetical protein QNJ58_20240 [Desulfobacterales bacterium]|nr:hypothetical protein [Desulfobacterales bacterium]